MKLSKDFGELIYDSGTSAEFQFELGVLVGRLHTLVEQMREEYRTKVTALNPDGTQTLPNKPECMYEIEEILNMEG